MLRVVVAVTLAAALLGVSMPVVETARVDHADARVEAELDRLTAAATRLAERNDLAPPGVPGARRTVSVRFPRGTMGSSALARLSVPGPEAQAWNWTGTRLRYRIAGASPDTYESGVVLVGTPDGTTIRRGGRHRLVLELSRVRGHRAVVVRRPRLKSDGAASPEHDETGNGSHRAPP
jgi:hypothetical protein